MYWLVGQLRQELLLLWLLPGAGLGAVVLGQEPVVELGIGVLAQVLMLHFAMA
jgi:hypothetical protein